MAVVDGVAASNTLLTYTNITPGYCLHYVWLAYQAHGATSSSSYPTAYSAWLASSSQHPGDMSPPPGFPVYLGPRAGSNAGDVMISRGGGLCSATDWPYNGVTGIVSIQDRMRQTGRPYLGWTSDFLGNTIAGGSQPPAEPGEEEEMAIGYLNMTGEAGARRGGMYAVVSRPGAKPAAVFIGQAGPNDLAPVSDGGAIAQLQTLIDGLA